MIRKCYLSDINEIMNIWLNTNILAHDFIPSDYWKNNYNSVSKAIQNSEVYVYEYNGEIRGFIGLIENYIAGLFVDFKFQSQGIGSKLLSYAKTLKSSLTLNVYEENKKAVSFYNKQGFTIKTSKTDESTNHVEYEMVWFS